MGGSDDGRAHLPLAAHVSALRHRTAPHVAHIPGTFQAQPEFERQLACLARRGTNLADLGACFLTFLSSFKLTNSELMALQPVAKTRCWPSPHE